MRTENLLKYPIYVALSSILFCFTIDLSLFIDKSIQFFFAFSIGAVIISIFTIPVYLTLGKNEKIGLAKVDILIFISILYTSLHFVISDNSFQYYQVVYLTSGMAYLFSMSLLLERNIASKDVYLLFFLFGCIQAITCLLQYLQILSANNIYFSVIGTLNNPNITAMYICLCIPYCFEKIVKRKHRILYLTILLIFLVCMVILNSRTAYLGIFVITSIYLLKNKNIRPIYRNFKIKNKLIILSISLLVILSGCVLLYKNKQNSADGRIFIWKLSTEMILKNPIGYGYGYFEKEYNLYQSEYFNKNKPTEKEKTNARYTMMPYNDLLEHGVEGGIIGLILYVVIIGIFIRNAIKEEDTEAISILCAAFLMGCVNFITQAIPVWLLVLTASAKVYPKGKEIFILNRKSIISSALVLYMSFASFVIIKQMQAARSQKLFSATRNLIIEDKKNIKKRISFMEKASHNINTFGPFYHFYANILTLSNDTETAQVQYQIAKGYISTPQLYLDLGQLYLKGKKYTEAEEYFTTANNMVPSHFRAKYLLMVLYENQKKKLQSEIVAQEVMTMSFSEKNKDALKARKLARIIIDTSKHE